MSQDHPDWMGYDEYRQWDLDRQFRQYRAKRQHEDELARLAARKSAPPAKTPASQPKLRLQSPRTPRTP